MRTLIVSRDLLGPLTSRVRDMLQRRVDPQGPTTISFDNIGKKALPNYVGLTVVVVSAEIENGLEVLRRVRKSVVTL